MVPSTLTYEDSAVKIFLEAFLIKTLDKECDSFLPGRHDPFLPFTYAHFYQ